MWDHSNNKNIIKQQGNMSCVLTYPLYTRRLLCLYVRRLSKQGHHRRWWERPNNLMLLQISELSGMMVMEEEPNAEDMALLTCIYWIYRSITSKHWVRHQTQPTFSQTWDTKPLDCDPLLHKQKPKYIWFKCVSVSLLMLEKLYMVYWKIKICHRLKTLSAESLEEYCGGDAG